MHYRADPDGLDDDVFIALTHESGVRSHLWGSGRQGAPGPRFRAAGTEGAYVIQDVDGQEAQLRSGGSPATSAATSGVPSRRSGGDTCCAATPASRCPPPAARGTCSTPPSPPRSAATQPVPVDPWDAVATAAVLDAARASARTGQVVRPAAIA